MMKRILQSKPLFGLYLAISVFAICEIVTRAFFAIEIGPKVLFYGTDWYRNISPDDRTRRRQETLENETYARELAAHLGSEARPDSVEEHDNDFGSYSKFFPHEKKSTRDVDTGERIPVSINSYGFRGKEFDPQKPPGTVRVLTLGSSSTFGFYNRDHETYPFLLEQVLNESCSNGMKFEVINFGIPHSTSDEVAALVSAEGIPLDPDVITFYNGRNDSVLSRRYDGFGEKLYAVLMHRLMLVAFIDQGLFSERVAVADYAEKLEPYLDIRSRFYLENLTMILEGAESSGVQLIIANQQATSAAPYPRPEAERLPLKGVTYDQEVEAISAKIDRGEDVTTFEYSLLVHKRLMTDLEAWARGNDLTFVDVIDALNQDRHYLLSWVHLHPRANEVIAGELSKVILRDHCSKALDG